MGDVFARDDDANFSWTELFFNADNKLETEYLRNIFWGTLNNALDELPQQQKLIFVEKELEDISFKDIAQQTGVAVNTLLSRKRYAVLQLQNRLQTLHTELLNY